MCGAPIVFGMLLNAAKGNLSHQVNCLFGGAAPPASILRAHNAWVLTSPMFWPDRNLRSCKPSVPNSLNGKSFRLTCSKQPEMVAKVFATTQEAVAVLDPVTMQPALGWRNDGEIMFRGNIVMKGYLKNEKATQESFEGGWFHTGDLAVVHSDGYVKIKDRSKDVIISGGENISSLEVEEVLYRHPAVIAGSGRCQAG